MLSGLLPSDNSDIVDEGVRFGWRENAFTGHCLATNDFLCQINPAFGHHITIHY
jgi:hypothetical protein